MHALLLTLLLAQADPAPPEFFAPNDEVRGYILQTIDGDTRHPALNTMIEEHQAGLQRVPQATALDDPMLQFNYYARSSGGEGRYSVMVSQMFPWFGTRKARGQKAEAEADATLAQFYAERNERIAAIKKAYADYAFLGERTRIAMEQVEVLAALEDVARSRYALGIGGQEDLLRIGIEEAKLQASYDCCALEKAMRAGALNEAMGREASEDLPFPQPMELPPPPPPAPVVLARIRVANPAFNQLDATIESREHEITIARKMGRPNITVGMSYTDMKDLRNEPRAGAVLDALDSGRRLVNPARPPLPPPIEGSTTLERAQSAIGNASALRREGVDALLGGAMDLKSLVELENAFDNMKMKDEIMVSVGVNLPIWRKKVRAGIEEARHMKQAAEHEKRQTAVTLEGAAKLAIFGMEDGYRRLRLYDDHVLPQARRTYETLQSAYASGTGDVGFIDVLTSVQALLVYEEERAEAVRDIHVAAADLELIMGGPWTAEESAPLPDLPAVESEASSPAHDEAQTPEP